ncbi:MAG TPA: hypothetical protein VFS88_07415 [Micavibrio sp.]|nr:hypothetical protein [Micavibrio sp.]
MMVTKSGSLTKARTDFLWATTFAGQAVFIGVQANDWFFAAVAGGLAAASVYQLSEGICEVARYIKPEQVVEKDALPAPQPAQP